MPLTVDSCVNEVVGRLAGKLAAVGIPTTTDHTNLTVVACLRKGLAWLGRTPATSLVLVDADLLLVTGWNVEKLCDAATLELCYVILGQCADVDQKILDGDMKLSQIETQTRAIITMLEERLRKPYGPSVPVSGVTLDPNVRMPNDPFAPFDSRAPWQTDPYPR